MNDMKKQAKFKEMQVWKACEKEVKQRYEAK